MLTVLGKFLRTFRIENGELLKDMADKLELAPAYISSIENGKRSATESFVKKIIEVYNFDLKQTQKIMDAYFLSEEEVKFSIKDADNNRRELGVAFARKFNSLNDEQINKIRMALKEDA